MTSPATSTLFTPLTFCVNGPFSVSTKDLKATIVEHGGGVHPAFSISISHLLTNAPLTSRKVQQAIKYGKPVVNEQWVTDSIKAGKLLPTLTIPSADKDEEEEEEEEEAAPPPVFEGLTFVLAGPFPSHSVAEMRQLIEGEKGGGRVSASLTKAVTHVIAEALGSKKTDAAEKKGLPIMKPAWVDACIAQGKLITDPAMECKAEEEEEEEEEEKEEEEEEEEKDDDVAPPKKKQKTATSSSSSSPSPPSPAPPVQLKTVVVKGSAPVDEGFPHASRCHVFEDDDGVWDCMLNQTNIGANANKFYVIQLLETDSGGTYYFWSRWGRVGERGQSGMSNSSSLEAAKKEVDLSHSPHITTTSLRFQPSLCLTCCLLLIRSLHFCGGDGPPFGFDGAVREEVQVSQYRPTLTVHHLPATVTHRKQERGGRREDDGGPRR